MDILANTLKILNLRQNTHEWKEYRKSRIGASDFAVFACFKGLSYPIFNNNFNQHLYNKKNDVNITNKYIEYGKDKEDILLASFNHDHDTICMPTIVQSLESENIFCSLDGYDPLNKVAIEIKTTSSDSSKYKEKMQYYIFQIAHQLYCSNFSEIHILFEFTDKVVMDKIKIDELPINREEWLNLCNQYLEILNKNDDGELIGTLDTYHEIGIKIKELELEKNMILSKIKEKMMKESINNGVFGNYLISTVEKKSYKYSEYIKDHNIVLDDKYLSTSSYLKINKKEI